MAENTGKVIPLKKATSKKKNALSKWMTPGNIQTAKEVVNTALGALRGHKKLQPYVDALASFTPPTDAHRVEDVSGVLANIRRARTEIIELEAAVQNNTVRRKVTKLRTQLDTYLDIYLENQS